MKYLGPLLLNPAELLLDGSRLIALYGEVGTSAYLIQYPESSASVLLLKYRNLRAIVNHGINLRDLDQCVDANLQSELVRDTRVIQRPQDVVCVSSSVPNCTKVPQYLCVSPLKQAVEAWHAVIKESYYAIQESVIGVKPIRTVHFVPLIQSGHFILENVHYLAGEKLP